LSEATPEWRGESGAPTPGPGQSDSKQDSSTTGREPPVSAVENRAQPGGDDEGDDPNLAGTEPSTPTPEQGPEIEVEQVGEQAFDTVLEPPSNEGKTHAVDKPPGTLENSSKCTDEALVPGEIQQDSVEPDEAEGNPHEQNRDQDELENRDLDESTEPEHSEPDFEPELEDLIAFDALEQGSSSTTRSITQAGLASGDGPKQGHGQEIPDLEDGELEPGDLELPPLETPPKALEPFWDPFPGLSPSVPCFSPTPSLPPALRPPNLTRFAFEIVALLRPSRRPRSSRATHGRGTLDPVRYHRGFERLYLQEEDAGRPQPLALHLLIDTSSSMDVQDRLLEAKRCAASLLMAGEEAGSEVELLGFGSGATLIKTAQDSTDAALERLERLQAHGGTSLEGALQHTLRSVSAQNPDGAALVVFLSDGDLFDLPACQRLLQSFQSSVLPRPETRFLVLLIGAKHTWRDLGVEVVRLKQLSAATGPIRTALERIRDDLERREGY